MVSSFPLVPQSVCLHVHSLQSLNQTESNLERLVAYEPGIQHFIFIPKNFLPLEVAMSTCSFCYEYLQFFLPSSWVRFLPSSPCTSPSILLLLVNTLFFISPNSTTDSEHHKLSFADVLYVAIVKVFNANKKHIMDPFF